MIDTDAPLPDIQHAVTAYGRAVDLLVRREHCRAELRHKLTKRGYDNGEIDAALDRLSDEGYLSDVRFAQLYAEQRAHKGYGQLKIQSELVARGVDGDLARQQVADLDADWVDIARTVLLAKSKPSDDYARLRRVLERRGFTASVAHKAIAVL